MSLIDAQQVIFDSIKNKVISNNTSQKWVGALLITPLKEEFFGILFDKNLSVQKYRRYSLEHGDLFFEYSRACKNKPIYKFPLKGIIENNNNYICEILEGFVMVFHDHFLRNTFNQKEKDKQDYIEALNVNWDPEFMQIESLIGNIRISRPVFFEDGTSGYIVISDFISLVAYETMEMYRLKKDFCKCDCGLWYTRRKGQHKNHCPLCPSKSKTTKAWSQYMREYRNEKKKIKSN